MKLTFLSTYYLNQITQYDDPQIFKEKKVKLRGIEQYRY